MSRIISAELAKILDMHIQLKNGYHVSAADYSDFLDAVIAVNKIHLQAKKNYLKNTGV